MKICILGAGAIGATLGVRLAQAGHQVNAVARGTTLEQIRARGLGLIQDGVQTLQPVRAVDNPGELGVQDLVVIAVKAPALPAAVRRVTPLLGSQTRVLTAINGVPWWFFDGLPGPLAGATLKAVDPAGDLRSFVPSPQVIGCVVHISCSLAAPGLAQHNFGSELIVGDALGGASAALDAVAAALAGAGFAVRQSASVQRDIWFKLLGNMTMNPVSALTGATCDRILAEPGARALCSAVMEEATLVGRHIGCALSESAEERHAVTARLGAFKTSMLQDAEAGRPLEVEGLVGAVVEIARRLDLAIPHTETLYGLIRLFAASRESMRSA